MFLDVRTEINERLKMLLLKKHYPDKLFQLMLLIWQFKQLTACIVISASRSGYRAEDNRWRDCKCILTKYI